MGAWKVQRPLLVKEGTYFCDEVLVFNVEGIGEGLDLKSQ